MGLLRNETPPEIIVPLICDCGNRDDTGIVAPPCSAECGRRMRLDDRLKKEVAEARAMALALTGEPIPENLHLADVIEKYVYRAGQADGRKSLNG